MKIIEISPGGMGNPTIKQGTMQGVIKFSIFLKKSFIAYMGAIEMFLHQVACLNQ